MSPVRVVARDADLDILLVSQRENLLNPFNTGAVKIHKVIEGIVFGGGIGDWRGILSPAADYISW
jgi:hypothetical protein